MSLEQPSASLGTTKRDPADPQQTLIPDGEYIVSVMKIEQGTPYGRPAAFVHCDVFEPSEHSGAKLIRYVNLPHWWSGKGASKGRLARSSSLYADFVAITQKLPPNRKFDLAKLYRQSLLRVAVVTVTDRPGKGKRTPMAEVERYSKIERILGQEAGPHGGTKGFAS
jgi:hypothetical protein